MCGLWMPVAAGGAVDTAARIVAEKLQELRQSAVMENRPGAGSLIGTNFVAKGRCRGDRNGRLDRLTRLDGDGVRVKCRQWVDAVEKGF